MENETIDLNATTKWQTSNEHKTIIWPDGIYHATVKEIGQFQAEHGTKIRMIFNIMNPKKESVELAYSVYPKVTERTKAGQLVQALGVTQGMDFVWEGLVGTPCRVLLEKKVIDGMEKSVIGKVMALQ